MNFKRMTKMHFHLHLQTNQLQTNQCPEDWDKIEDWASNLDRETVFLFNVNERQREFFKSDGNQSSRPMGDNGEECTPTKYPDTTWREPTDCIVNPSHYLARVACAGRGNFGWIEHTSDLPSQMEAYFDFVLKRSHGYNISWTSPYVDASGLGLVLTASMPVYDKQDNLVAVVGLDATLEDLEVSLRDARWGEVSTFLIDTTGDAIVHPLLVPVRELLSGPIFPDIQMLEMVGGQPDAFKAVRESMINGETGSKTILRKRGVPLGGRDKGLVFVDTLSTYYYGPVPNSGFSFAFVCTSFDIKYQRLAANRSAHDPNSVHYAGKSYYHRIQDYKNVEDFPDQSIAGPVSQLDIQSFPFIKGEYVSKTHSSFKLTPSSFCDPMQYYKLDAAGDLTKAVDEAVNGAASADDISCDVPGTLLRPWAVADIKLTWELQQHWLTRASDDIKDVVWTYIGTQNGVFRTFPG